MPFLESGLNDFRCLQANRSELKDWQYAKGIAWTCYSGHAVDDAHQSGAFTPIGSLIASLSRKLAWENPSLRQLAEYCPKTGIQGSGGGTICNWAPASIYGEEVYAQPPAR